MTNSTSTLWLGDMAFEAMVNNHKIVMDTDTQLGGKDLGPRPKPLLLAALSGCAGMEIVSILKKMKIEDYKFAIDAEADVVPDHPAVYNEIRLIFRFWGENLHRGKIIQAINLSFDYCPVYAMLSKAIKIVYLTFINEAEVTL
ncbi:MAG: OsmC family protein [Candidatus Cloacimonetes bacterium]|nr:OsmC family protein [Candidatus Cloacimonadota bacterium]